MDNHLKKIKKLLAESAVHIDKYGHHQNDMWQGKACCIMGAPRMVDNESSYSHILRDVLAHMGYSETWNDKPGRTKQEVVSALIEVATQIDEQIMQDVYGEQWRKILDFITDLDNWTESDYNQLEETVPPEEFPPGKSPEEKEYTNGLASYLSTVMTSGHARNSMPFKNHFDRNYIEWNRQ